MSDYERKDSPWVWIQHGDTYEDRQYLKTAIRKNDPDKKRKVARELNRLEAQLIPGLPVRDKRDGWRWVPDFISTRYAANPLTRRVYEAQWRQLGLFLAENQIGAPAELSRSIAADDYLPWRCSQVKQKSRRNPKINTAIGELKLLAMVMDEAVTRKLTSENPARNLGIKGEEAELKPEITKEMFGIIQGELQSAPRWMQRSFFVGLNTALRFATTRLHRNQIRTISDDILIEKPKGGRKREFAIPIYESIRDEIERFLRSSETYFWTAPRGTLTGLEFSKFFKRSRAYVPLLCFHSTRITFITRGMRNGIPEPVMMKMVNHADKDISRIYQRWTSDDVRRYADQLPSLTESVGPTRNQDKTTGRR